MSKKLARRGVFSQKSLLAGEEKAGEEEAGEERIEEEKPRHQNVPTRSFADSSAA